MPELSFQVEKAEPIPHAATPQLAFRLDVRTMGPTQVHSIVLRCQIRIEPARRRYGPDEQERLHDLFDEPERWGQTLQPMLWTHAGVVVPAFTGKTAVDLPVPCTYDFNVASTKYFAALEDGEVPLRLLFSGTIFYEAPGRGLQVDQIPWDKETAFRLPVQVWKEMMDHYYPNSAWLCLRKDVFDQLYQYKRERGLPTWEQALESLLAAAEQPRT
jgi:hypothetical protein